MSEFVRRTPKYQIGKEKFNFILETAESLIAEIGIDQFKMNQIANRANISIGSLYQYFPNKNSIIGSLLMYRLENVLEMVRSLMSSVTELQQFKSTTSQILDLAFSLSQTDPNWKEFYIGAQYVKELRNIYVDVNTDFANMFKETLIRINAPIPRERLFPLCYLFVTTMATVLQITSDISKEKAHELQEEAKIMVLSSIDRELKLS